MAKFRIHRARIIAVTVTVTVALAGASGGAAEAVRFSRDVLPILSENCFACHGPDEGHRAADLRLDTREGALAVITLDTASESELIARVIATDPDVQMPPPTSHKKPLSQEQVEILTRWIAEGAPWGTHWAFEPPAKPPVPEGHPHPIDAFVGDRLAAEKLDFAPQAAPHVLARRLALDLTGLPPSPTQAESLAADAAGGAYEKIVDELLASPHFGERMAMWWLDAARYADTDGFQGDANRTNWPWRRRSSWSTLESRRSRRPDAMPSHSFWHGLKRRSPALQLPAAFPPGDRWSRPPSNRPKARSSPSRLTARFRRAARIPCRMTTL